MSHGGRGYGRSLVGYNSGFDKGQQIDSITDKAWNGGIVSISVINIGVIGMNRLDGKSYTSHK